MSEPATPGDAAFEPIVHTLKLRTEAVTRLLMGEDLHRLATEMKIPPKQLEQWAKEFCRAGEMRLRLLPDNRLERWLALSEKLVPIATLVSVLLAVTLFVQGQHKEMLQSAKVAAMERESRVRDAYTALDDKYLDYVKVCLEHPDLDVFDKPMLHPLAPTEEQRRESSMVLSMLMSVMERAYLMFSSPGDAFERNQWTAWSNYMTAWAGRENFRAEWHDSRTEFDANFTGYVDQLIRTTPATKP